MTGSKRICLDNNVSIFEDTFFTIVNYISAPCPTGYFSFNGYYPCDACPIGYYAADEGSTDCSPCDADDESTALIGSTSADDCVGWYL